MAPSNIIRLIYNVGLNLYAIDTMNTLFEYDGSFTNAFYSITTNIVNDTLLSNSTHFTIPGGVGLFNNYASQIFYSNKLIYLYIAYRFQVPAGAFANCIALQTVIYSNIGAANISDYMFQGCLSLNSINLHNVTSIGNYSFSGCSALTLFTIPDTVISIGENAFASTGLTSLTIYQTTTTIANTFINSNNGIIIYTDNVQGPIRQVIININNNLSTYNLTTAVRLRLIGSTTDETFGPTIPLKNQYNIFNNGEMLRWYYTYWD